MAACLDLSKIFLKRQHGDLLAVYTWMDGDRVLILMPANRAKAPWFVVHESAAYLYDDPHYMAKRCPEAAAFMGLGADRATWVRIATIINEGLPDLVLMPSEPDWEAAKARQFGEMVVREAGGQVVHEEALTVPEHSGVSYVTA